MGRHCALTGKTLQSGHNVSHSKRRTNRKFLPNLQPATLVSDAIGTVRLRVCTRALRTVQKKGGLDAFLLSTDDRNLPEEALKLKSKVRRALSMPKAAAATTA